MSLGSLAVGHLTYCRKYETTTASMEKRAEFVGSSLADLRRFPKEIRDEIGYQIYRLQCGLDPSDWKPMPNVGSGVREIRVRGADRNYRAIYVTTVGDAVYVLHVFVKKSNKTRNNDLDVARKRLSEI